MLWTLFRVTLESRELLIMMPKVLEPKLPPNDRFCTSFCSTAAPVWYWSQTQASEKPSPAAAVPTVLPDTRAFWSSVVVEGPIRKIPYCAFETRLLTYELFELAASAAAIPESCFCGLVRCARSSSGTRAGAVVLIEVPPE